MSDSPRGLGKLARLYGIQTSYSDASGTRQRATPEALYATLRVLGAEIHGADDIRRALRSRRRELWERPIEPVVVCWEGRENTTLVRRPSSVGAAAVLCRLVLEDGDTREWRFDPGEPEETCEIGGRRYVAHRMTLPADIPLGYHALELHGVQVEASARLICAPRRAYMPYRSGERDWGVFAPLYAIRSEASWGSGSFTDLEHFGEWVRGLGGSVVGTLPLLATYLDEQPFDPSPYSPVSRLFWNESYLDPARAPGVQSCGAARKQLESDALAERVRELRASDAVDYKALQAARRTVLEPAARCFFENGGQEEPAFQRFLQTYPLAEEYARFRGTVEHEKSGWGAWPERQRRGELRKGDYEEDARQFHLYAQFAATQQLEAISKSYRAGGGILYLDLPLGTRPDGFDTWKFREIFADGVSTGAPPDPFFNQGQSWGFPPLDPHRSRADGWRYFIECIRNHLRYAGMLRLDHVMGLHRLYWIPPGASAKEGLYVRYPAEELYAILCLESKRHKAMLVGEDLGTVPNAVRRGMGRHGIQRMSVLQYEISPGEEPPIQPPERARVASINTHDMPTFAGFWRAHDVDERRALSLLDDEGATEELRNRDQLRDGLTRGLRAQRLLGGDEHDTAAVHRAALAHFGRSKARVVLVTLEDLWEETRPQNMPGTFEERPNWRRKAELGIEEFSVDPRVLEQLEALDRSRDGEDSDGGS